MVQILSGPSSPTIISNGNQRPCHSSHGHILRWSGWIQLAALQCLHSTSVTGTASSCLCCLVFRHPDRTGAKICCFCNSILLWFCLPIMFPTVFSFFFLKCCCMQCREWIIPCYEFIQRPKGPLICTVEHLMNRSQMGPESYEVRLSSSLFSRWTMNRGLLWYTKRKAHCWGEKFQESLPKRPAKESVQDIMCISSLFLWANNTSKIHNSLQTRL